MPYQYKYNYNDDPVYPTNTFYSQSYYDALARQQAEVDAEAQQKAQGGGGAIGQVAGAGGTLTGTYLAAQAASSATAGGAATAAPVIHAAYHVGTGAGASAGASAGAGAGAGGGAGIGTAANGGTMLANGTTTGGSAATSTAGSYAGTAGQVLGGAAALYGGYTLGDMALNHKQRGGASGRTKGALAGAAVGTYIMPGIGTLLGGLAGTALGSIRSGKHVDHYYRDRIRESLVKSKAIDKDFNITLADGHTYNIGVDGGPRAEFGGYSPHAVDMTRKNIGQVIGMMNPLSAIVVGDDRSGYRSNMAGYYTNAAASGGDAVANARKIYESHGIKDLATAKAQVDALVKAGKMDAQTGQIYKAGLHDVFDAPKPGSKSSTGVERYTYDGQASQRALGAGTSVRSPPPTGPSLADLGRQQNVDVRNGQIMGSNGRWYTPTAAEATHKLGGGGLLGPSKKKS